MATITNKQIQDINCKCSNNWRLNVQHYLNWREKTLLKNIEIDSNSYLQFSLHYNSLNQIILSINKFEYIDKEQGVAKTEGLGKTKLLDETVAKRKNVNNLIELTKKLTDDELLKINKDTQIEKNCLIVESEEF